MKNRLIKSVTDNHKKSLLTDSTIELRPKQPQTIQNLQTLRLDDVILDKPPQFRILSNSTKHIQQIVKIRNEKSSPTNIQWMYNYKSASKLNTPSAMNEYLKCVIEEHKLKPTISKTTLSRVPYFSHKEFIRDKYVYRKKIFVNLREQALISQTFK